jgi:cytochrome c biogenesis protein CcdA/thiol-disulfide isomerase/thioredoxin
MTLLLISYLAGALTVFSPCIFPILPFVLARADAPFRQNGLPMLLGLAFTFAATASLASVAGGWAVEANILGRNVALAAMALFGLTMLFPGLAGPMTKPLAAFGSRLALWVSERALAKGRSMASSALLGVATGLLWAPCAGPVLGLILTGAALRGPNLETTFLLLTYGLGAGSALGAGVLVGGTALAKLRPSLRWSDRLRRLMGAAVIAGVASIAFGLDTGLLTRWSSSAATGLDQLLINNSRKETALIMESNPTKATSALSAPLLSLLAARIWLNGAPLRPEDLRGKVVLVNFWTYSCINCLRTLPQVREWAEKYRERGLQVVGVHSPEFAFEKDVGQVSKALTALQVSYPIAVDNNLEIWRALGNQAWPAFYLIDADGRIRYRSLGEGGYDSVEKWIQRLLSEAKSAPVTLPVAPVSGEGSQAEADRDNLGSGETYIGYAQARGFASPGGLQEDVATLYKSRSPLPINRWALRGAWTVGSEFATLNARNGSIAYRFHARDLHLVLAPSTPEQSIRYRVTIDGEPPGADHGADTDAAGWGMVQDARLYQLVRQNGAIADRTFEIEFFDAGVRAYAFTFG